MKKKTSFYIGWIIGFVILQYLYNKIYLWAREEYYHFSINVDPFLWGMLLAQIFIGIYIACFLFVTSRYEYTRKLALIEFLIIGIPSFYLAGALAIQFGLGSLFHLERLLCPMWLMNSEQMVRSTSSILLGYEIFMLIIRMIKSKKDQRPMVEDDCKLENQ